MYGVKLKNIEEVYNKSKFFIRYKNILDKIISAKYDADIYIGSSSSFKVKAVLLIPMLQQQIHELGTELKEFGVDLEES